MRWTNVKDKLPNKTSAIIKVIVLIDTKRKKTRYFTDVLYCCPYKKNKNDGFPPLWSYEYSSSSTLPKKWKVISWMYFPEPPMKDNDWIECKDCSMPWFEGEEICNDCKFKNQIKGAKDEKRG